MTVVMECASLAGTVAAKQVKSGEIRLQATCVHSVTVRTEHVNIKRKITQETPGDGSGGSQRSTKFIETDPQLSKRAECPL